jgi:hypothetical protein
MMGYSRSDVDSRVLTWRKMTPPEWVAATEEQFSKLETSGHLGPYEKEYLCRDGSRRWMLFAGRKLDDGTIAEYCIDISDRKRAERERELLARELSHRVKNTLAVVEALAQQTAGKSVEEFCEKFGGRLRALSQAHALLLDSDWRGVDLKELLEEALSAHRADDPRRAELDGAPISLTPKQALGLRLHRARARNQRCQIPRPFDRWRRPPSIMANRPDRRPSTPARACRTAPPYPPR